MKGAGATEPDGRDLASTVEELTFAQKGKKDRTAATQTPTALMMKQEV